MLAIMHRKWTALSASRRFSRLSILTQLLRTLASTGTCGCNTAYRACSSIRSGMNSLTLHILLAHSAHPMSVSAGVQAAANEGQLQCIWLQRQTGVARALCIVHVQIMCMGIHCKKNC